MQMYQENSWLLDKAKKEDGCQASVGGLTGDIEKMSSGLAGTTAEETRKMHGITSTYVPNPYYGWWGIYNPSDPWYDYYYPRVTTVPSTKPLTIDDWTNLLAKKDSNANKLIEQFGKELLSYKDPEVDKLEKKLAAIKDKIDAKKRAQENAAKIKELNDRIAKAEADLAAM